jgi:hypothetical protein
VAVRASARRRYHFGTGPALSVGVDRDDDIVWHITNQQSATQHLQGDIT